MKALVALCIYIAGTTAIAQPAGDWRAYVTVEDSAFDKFIRLAGRRAGEGQFYGQPARSTQLISLVSKADGTVSHAIVFADRYDGSGWRFWSSVATNKAQSLKIAATNREVGSCSRYSGCSHYETLYVEVPEQILAEATTESIQVRFTGRGETHIVTIDPDDASRQLAASRAARDQVIPPTK